MPKRPAKRSSTRLSTTAKSQPKADRPFAPGYGIVGAEDGKGLLSWAWVARKMNNCRTFWLATIHAGRARPHVMPVCRQNYPGRTLCSATHGAHCHLLANPEESRN